MLLYSRAMKMFREAGSNYIDLKNGVRIERGSGIVLFYGRVPFLKIRDGSMYEYWTEAGFLDHGMYVKLCNKFGPKIGLSVSKRGFLVSSSGIIVHGMTFDRHGKLVSSMPPERSTFDAADPASGTPEYKVIFGNDDEQENPQIRPFGHRSI